MKNKLFTFAVLLPLFAVVFSACKDKGNDEPNYPVKISFDNYSLEDSSCQWTNLPFNDKVIIINSKEELEKYISCTENSYPEVDFEKYTLVLAHGLATSNVLKINSSLQQISKQVYEMKVEVLVGYALVMTYWYVPIIVNKLRDGCIVELIASYYPPDFD